MFHKIRGTLGGPYNKDYIVYWGLYWGLLVLGNYQILGFITWTLQCNSFLGVWYGFLDKSLSRTTKKVLNFWVWPARV